MRSGTIALLLSRIVILGVAGACVTSTASDLAGSRAAEVRELVASILSTHPEGPRLATDSAFVGAAARLEQVGDGLHLASYIVELHRLFSLVHDGHTAILSTELPEEPFTLRTPILVHPFADGVWVLEAKDEGMSILGGRVVSVNDVPIDEILAAYVEGAPADNPAFAMRWSPFLLAFPGWLHGLGVVEGPYDSPIAVEVVTPAGETVRAELKPREGANLGRSPLERRLSVVEEMAAEEGSPNFVRVVSERRALYVSIDAMEDTETKSFAEFTREVREALGNPEVARVIVDLRRNGGGNNMLAEPLRRTLVKSRFNQPGGIYVLIGPRTFSAAMNLATRLERETDALFVGEPTGGRPNHYGDAIMRTGSATGVPYLVSTVRWQDSPPFDERIWLLPDTPAPRTFAEYMAGRDEALEIAMSHTPPTDWPGDREAMPWARPSQRAGWRFFFEPGSGGVSGPAH